jgi:prepilin-type N-terminal cleavage/methylation domain-containing protein
MGFSLIEMVTVLSVMCVLLAIAARARIAHLGHAVSAAQSVPRHCDDPFAARLKRGAIVASRPSPVHGAEFSGGWTIFVDANGNGC